MNYSLRPLAVPDDYPALAALLTRVSGDESTPESLAQGDQRWPAGTIQQRLAAVDDQTAEIMGYGYARRAPYQPDGQFTVRATVAPEARRLGIGSALLEAAGRFVREQGGTSCQTFVKDDDHASLAYAEKRGYTQDKHLFWSELDLVNFEPERFLGAVRALEQAGIRFSTLAAEPGAETLRQLYELDRHASADNPGEDLPDFVPYEDWLRFFTGRSDRPADLCFFAKDGDRVTGITDMMVRPDGQTALVGFTGVHREYRGRGIALAVKTLAIQAARERGLRRLRTENDSRNGPMLAVNRKMGFVPQPGYFELVRKL